MAWRGGGHCPRKAAYPLPPPALKLGHCTGAACQRLSDSCSAAGGHNSSDMAGELIGHTKAQSAVLPHPHPEGLGGGGVQLFWTELRVIKITHDLKNKVDSGAGGRCTLSRKTNRLPGTGLGSNLQLRAATGQRSAEMAQRHNGAALPCLDENFTEAARAEFLFQARRCSGEHRCTSRPAKSSGKTSH